MCYCLRAVASFFFVCYRILSHFIGFVSFRCFPFVSFRFVSVLSFCFVAFRFACFGGLVSPAFWVLVHAFPKNLRSDQHQYCLHNNLYT